MLVLPLGLELAQAGGEEQQVQGKRGLKLAEEQLQEQVQEQEQERPEGEMQLVLGFGWVQAEGADWR